MPHVKQAFLLLCSLPALFDVADWHLFICITALNRCCIQVKAGVGATGVMMYLDTRTNNCCIARMGDSLPFVAESKGKIASSSTYRWQRIHQQ